MTTTRPLPRLITFDGEARSGKGTVVQTVKDHLRDTFGYKVMLIDAGQVFRVLVVAAMRDGVSLEDPLAIDAFLADETKVHSSVELVKHVYHMQKEERDALLYTNEVGANSAKVGARPLSQEFKDSLLKKWLKDAHEEGYDIVLLDGRALEETGTMLTRHGLCEFEVGLYFVCDANIGARRTLGFAHKAYDELSEFEKIEVDTLIRQIEARNHADRVRTVQPVIAPEGAIIWELPQNLAYESPAKTPSFYVVDTSADMAKADMTKPVCDFIGEYVSGN